MKVYYINTNETVPKVIDIKHDINEFLRLLNCRMFDIVTRKIGGIEFDIYCDDEFLFTERPLVTAVYEDLEPQLCNNLIITHSTPEGETIGITDEDVKVLDDHIAFNIKYNGGDIDKSVFYPVLMMDSEE